MHSTSLCASKHKSPLFQPLEHCTVHGGRRKVSGGGSVIWVWQCVVCWWCLNTQHSCSTPRFYSLPMLLFLALLLELHIIEVFVLCGCLCWAVSMLGKCSVAAACGIRWSSHSTPLKTWLYPLFESCSCFFLRSGWRLWHFLTWHVHCGVVWGKSYITVDSMRNSIFTIVLLNRNHSWPWNCSHFIAVISGYIGVMQPSLIYEGSWLLTRPFLSIQDFCEVVCDVHSYSWL